MGVVAGAPEGHRADEAGDGPRAAEGAQRTAERDPLTSGPVAEQTAEDARPSDSTVEQPVNEAQPDSEKGTVNEKGPDGEKRPDGEKGPDGTKGPNGEQSQQESEPASQTPGFGERGRMRRRARFLRKARELAYRDLGGLVFDLHRFGQRNDPLVLAKLATLSQIDTELRELEAVLRERRPVSVLREVGIAACPRCAAIHDSDDRFCPGCGLAFDANADRPISSAPVGPAVGMSTPTPISPTHATPPAKNIHQDTAYPTPQVPSRATPQVPSRTAPEVASGAARQTSAEAAPQPTQPPMAPSAAPVRAPGSAAGEDEPTQILRPPTRDT
jgi:hypothetical protein